MCYILVHLHKVLDVTVILRFLVTGGHSNAGTGISVGPLTAGGVTDYPRCARLLVGVVLMVSNASPLL